VSVGFRDDDVPLRCYDRGVDLGQLRLELTLQPSQLELRLEAFLVGGGDLVDYPADLLDQSPCGADDFSEDAQWVTLGLRTGWCPAAA
jgi:hypothetical protein